MKALLWKEFRHLSPYAALWAGLVLLYFGTELYTHRIDEVSFYGWCEQYCDFGTSPELVLFSLIFNLIIAYGLFTNEYESRSIDYLRSLPLSPQVIFFSKVLAGWLFLCVLIAFEHVIQYLLMLTNSQSLTGKWYYQIDFSFFYRECLFAFVILCHGVFISWFKVLGLMVYSGYLVAVLTLETQFSISKNYNVLRFYHNEFYGQQLIIDWEIVGLHLFIATVLLIVSYFLWRNRDSVQFVSRSGKLRKVISIVMTILAFVSINLLWVAMLETKQGQSDTSSLKTETTDHYRFVYKTNKQEAMDALLASADNDYKALAELLGTSDMPIIDADMSSENPHVLGLASWKKILLRLSNDTNDVVLNRRVLSHETAHVFQSTESDGKLTESVNSIDFFVEGMAQYTSFSIVSDELARRQNWLTSAVAWDRQQIKFDELANKSLFDEKYDAHLLYGIGDVWVEALVQVCSEPILGEFLREHQKKDAPIRLSGYRYWFNMLGRLGCDLEQVNAKWRSLLRSQLESNATVAYPIIENIQVAPSKEAHLVDITATMVSSGEVSKANDSLLSGNSSADAPGSNNGIPDEVFIKVRSEKGFGRSVDPVLSGEIVDIKNTATGYTAKLRFTINKSLLIQGRLDYQLGYPPEIDSRIYFDKWRSATVR